MSRTRRHRGQKRKRQSLCRFTKVFCPGCRQYFLALCQPAWARREARRLHGYPELVCWPCNRATEKARLAGGCRADWRNHEEAAC